MINCEINIILTWSRNCVISPSIRKIKNAITDKNFYVPIVTLSAQDNAKLLERLRCGFKGTVNWNKYQLKVSTERKKLKNWSQFSRSK